METVLLTGANGFTGYYIAKQLLQNNYKVVATGKGPERLSLNGNMLYETMDFTSQEDVQRIFDLYQPSYVVHAGALSKPDECEENREAAFRTNVTGTIYVAQAAAKYQSFLVFLSTDFVFDGRTGMYAEDDERSPVNYYGTTKMLAEDEVMRYPFQWAVVRTVLVYGKPLQGRQNLLTFTCNALKKGERIRIFDDQVRTPTYVEDLAAGVVAIIQRKASGIFHIAGKDVLSPYGMAVATARYLGLDAGLIERIREGDLLEPANRPLKTGLDISKAERVLGYKPVSFDEGLKKTFA